MLEDFADEVQAGVDRAVATPFSKKFSRRSGQGPSAAVGLQWASQYRVHDAPVMPSIERWDLGAGESQVIAHSVGTARWAVLDDRAARRCAAAHGVAVIGSLGLVLRAKKKRHVDRARPLIGDLIAAGMFVDDEFIRGALENVAE